MYYFYFYQFTTTCFQSGHRDLLPDTEFAPLKNIVLLSICYPLKTMGNTCIDTWSWTEVEWPWFLWRTHRHLFLVKQNIPRYYIYHKVRNRSFDNKSRSSRFSRFLNSTDASMEEWPTSSETTIIYLQNDVLNTYLCWTSTIQQTFSHGSAISFHHSNGKLGCCDPQWKKKEEKL